MIMAWKSIYQERSRYQAGDRRETGAQTLKSLPGWVKQTIVCCFILTVLLGASQAPGGLAGRVVSFAKGAVEDDLAFEEVKAWIAGLPEKLRSLATLDIRDFWSRATSGEPTELAWPVSGEVTSVFGWRPNQDSSGLSLHQGIDIEAPVGTEVSSVLDGVVASV
jgi:murein DD-endopeptidase MepM/ murein hydrolase activator NlpD